MDCQRESFRMYVEKSGIMSTLTDVLVQLYEQPVRPEQPLEYVRSVLAAGGAGERLGLLEEKVGINIYTIF